MAPELELQGIIVQRLIADTTVASLINGRVYDRVPENPEFPYVSIGPVDSNDDDAECITVLDIWQQIDVWSRAVGYPECKRISDAVRASLHDYEVELPTNGLVFIEHRQTRTMRDPDGITNHGALSFQASIERA